jgi:polyhydroxybutyrate depolymerase
MKLLLLLVFLLCMSLAQDNERVILEHGGQERAYELYVPTGYANEPLPLVIAMHSADGRPSTMNSTSGVKTLAEKENFFVLFTDSLGRGLNALICCGSEDDVGHVRAALEDVQATYKVDPKRIYATGISNGGDMSVRLAMELSDVLAAVAPVSGGLSDATKFVAPTSPASVITFYGAKDRYYPVFEEGMKVWQEGLGCSTAEEETLDEERGITRTRSSCSDGSEVVVYRFAEMAHQWPKGKEDGVTQGMGLSATYFMWEFFKAHPKP